MSNEVKGFLLAFVLLVFVLLVASYLLTVHLPEVQP